MAHVADALKQKGNDLFKAGDFAGAEQQYTQAIQRYSSNPLLFTNRAFARLKLQQWEGVIDDCLHSIDLTGHGQNHKAYFYLAQAQLALNHPHEALASSLRAYDQVMNPTSAASVTSATSSIGPISTLVLKCKRARFALLERERLHQRSLLLGDLLTSLETTKSCELDSITTSLHANTLGAIAAAEARAEILDSHERKTNELRTVFALADPSNQVPKEVPDYLVDSITFEIMHDPVMTKNGHSYEKATLREHLKRSQTDPLTREVLREEELRPNIALRKACEEFWEGAGAWAGDW